MATSTQSSRAQHDKSCFVLKLYLLPYLNYSVVKPYNVTKNHLNMPLNHIKHLLSPLSRTATNPFGICRPTVW